ncbi:MAG TPA: hypothetical protein VF797_13280 [Noviherbaspirillum sp.]|jgi:hypothetical protein
MKPVIVLMILAAVAGCSSIRGKPYQASDTTASNGAASSREGPTQRSTQRMFNPDGSLGTYFGT